MYKVKSPPIIFYIINKENFISIVLPEMGFTSNDKNIIFLYVVNVHFIN
jgi:hypothetical protein